MVPAGQRHRLFQVQSDCSRRTTARGTRVTAMQADDLVHAGTT
jgi:hypothetical protein